MVVREIEKMERVPPKTISVFSYGFVSAGNLGDDGGTRVENSWKEMSSQQIVNPTLEIIKSAIRVFRV